MLRQSRIALVSAAAAAFLLAGLVPGFADDATMLGVSKNWSAYMSGSGGGKVCYALSKPKSSEPKKIARNPAYLLISDWPGRGAKAEPQVVPGYQYKDGSTVTAEVGSDKFTLFTKNDGGEGGAWVQSTADEARFIEAMKRGSQVIITGVSQRGTLTRDTYSLSGLSAALDKIHTACGM